MVEACVAGVFSIAMIRVAARIATRFTLESVARKVYVLLKACLHNCKNFTFSRKNSCRSTRSCRSSLFPSPC